jgi:tRNA A37 threonylcarbamoyladenosine dehydratase
LSRFKSLPNVSRHICGVGDLGRYKTKAVKDALLAKNPYTKVETAEIDINQNLALLGLRGLMYNELRI